MVQYKRKPVKLKSLPNFLDDDTEVWTIEETGEVFVDYEDYLRRRDFYSQKNFTCESTGHQGYTFFEALESEMEASKEINSYLPEGLRSRVLAFVQFKRTPRMDDLVNMVFEHFREHYLVGDRVSIEHDNSRRYGTITNMQDTSRLHILPGHPMDEHFRSYTYHITLEGSDEVLTKYKATELQRDRRVYSKLLLKQFLRSAVSREAWNGAPWMIKEHLAKRYNISTKIPEPMTRDAVIAAKKAANAANLPLSHSVTPPAHLHHGHNGVHAGTPPNLGPGHGLRSPFLGAPPPPFVNYGANGQPLYHPDSASGPPGSGSDLSRHMMGPPSHDPRGQPAYANMPPHLNGRLPPFVTPPFQQLQQQVQQQQPNQLTNQQPHQQLPPNIAQLAHHIPAPGQGLPISLPFQNNFMQYQTLAPTLPPQHVPQTTRFEPIRYPIEDLEIKQPRVSVQRPPMKFFSDDVPDGMEPPKNKTGLLMKSMTSLLSTWDTLNVHDVIYSLDSFTFDDFVDSLRFSSDEVECELLVEMHCAVLKQIVNDSGRPQLTLPTITDPEDTEDEGSSKATTPEREPSPPVRTTRSSLRKSEASAIVKRTPTPEPPRQVHQAAEFLAEFDWIEQCKVRDFRDGGWQAILVGLLYVLSFSPLHKEICEDVLAELVPPDEEPSRESIAGHYVNLDINRRIAALELVTRLTCSTETFKDQLAVASSDMTRLRKEKIEYQRKRKELADELFKLDNERKIQLPLHMEPNSPIDVKENGDVVMNGTSEAQEDVEDGSEPEEVTRKGNRKLRHTKSNKRKRDSEAAKKEKAKKAKEEAAKTKQQQEWEKLLDDIAKKKEELRSCEASINELDDDLREAHVHRSKVIGKDRFLNKYYWFEHNGMPFGGVPNSSTAEYGYANGRLWVQGPDELELEPNLVEPALSQDRERLGFTIPERKDREEGETHLNKSIEWGYYDDPDDIDKILAWLDERGVREKALRKELLIYKDRISEYMIKMKEHLHEADKAKAEGEENATRVSTRTKTYVDKDVTKDRCLLWTNSIMREQEGYNHSEEYEPPKKTKKGYAKAAKAKSRR